MNNEKCYTSKKRGGATPLGSCSKGFESQAGGMCLFDDALTSGSAIVSKTHSPCSQSCDFWEKLLRYYDTKAVRGNRKVGGHYYADRKYTVGLVNPTCKKLKRFFAGAQNDKNTFLVPYCLSNLVSLKKAAFTLAEVLITLGIIGVVAAMTIPTLINKYQDFSLKVQFKKTYAVLQQAARRAEYEFTVQPKCYYWGVNPYGPAVCNELSEDGTYCEGDYVLVSTGEPIPADYNGLFSECPAFGEQMTKNLRVAKICKTKPFDNGCVPEYEGMDTYDGGSHAYSGMPKAMRKEWLMNENHTVVLADGTIIINGMGTQTISPQLFFVDINGKGGPNKWGYDIFPFRSVKDSAGNLKIGQANDFKEAGGKTVNEMLEEIAGK